MLGARVVIVANMKPANMRGIKSHAMVLCASSADGTQVSTACDHELYVIGAWDIRIRSSCCCKQQLRGQAKCFAGGVCAAAGGCCGG